MKKIIDLISIKIFEFIYSKQKKAHQKRMAKLKHSLKNGVLSGNAGGERIHTTTGATLTIKERAKQKKEANKQKIEELIKKHMYDIQSLFEYIKGANTPVYKIKFARNILNYIGEFEGFILPKKGLKALYLNLILNKKISFKTSEMFVVSSYDVNIYAFIYQFYNWYCFKMKLDGYEIETQEKFKHVFELCETSKINSLSYEEILNLKGAIKRDIEAIEFVQNFVKNYDMGKKNIAKIKEGKSIGI